MKKFTKLLYTLALLFGVVGGVKAEKKALSFETAEYCAATWDATTSTLTWGSGGWNSEWTFMAAKDISGDLSSWETLHLNAKNFTNASSEELKIVFKSGGQEGPTKEFTESPDENGDITMDLTKVDWGDCDITSIFDLTIYGGARIDGTQDASVVITDAYLERPDADAACPWTGVSELTNGSYYYIVNTETGLYLSAGSDWGTRAVVTTAPTGRIQANKLSDGHWKLKFEYKGDGLVQTGDTEYENIYTDRGSQANYQWNVVNVGGTDFTIQLASDMGGYNTSYYLAPQNNGVSKVVNNSTNSDLAKWRFVTEDEINTAIENSVEGTWVDVSSKMYNVSQGWAGGYGHQAATYGTLQAGFIERWTGGGGKLSDATASYTINNMPAGHYRLSADVIATQQNDGNNATYGGIYIFINGMQTECKTTNGNPKRFIVEADMAAAGTITVGHKSVNATCNWTGFGNVKLEYYLIDPLKAYKALLATSIANAEAVQESSTTTAAYNAVQTALNTYKTPEETEEAYSTAIAAIDEAVATANSLISNYSRYKDVKAAALKITSSVNTSDADEAVDAATTTAAIDAAIVTLRAAFLAELPNVTIGEAGYIDVTDVMVDNAGVHTNTDYWTKEGTPNGGYSFGVCNFGECEFYNCNFKFFQTLALARGTWEFGVTGFHRAGNHNTYFYAGKDDKILIPGVPGTPAGGDDGKGGIEWVNSMAQAKTYFDNGNGKVALKFVIESPQNVEIGIDNQDTETDKWTIFRDFTLEYYGAPDYSVYEGQWNDAVTAANTALNAQAYKYISGNERTAVTEAIADEPDGSSKANYIEKLDALDAAVATFKAAAPSYNAWVLAKTETKNLWGSALGVADPTTAAEAAAGVHALNVAQYNKVATEYTFSATGLIGDFGSWTGTATVAGELATPNYLDWEHWSGETHAYYEQAANGWGNANGWTVKYEKTCTLPAGSYVIKVAARSSAGTTSSVSCTETNVTISLPSTGNRARGINTGGVASWSDSDTFANGDINYPENAPTVGGTGTGWEWRFLPFTLTEQTEVTMTFYAEASSQYQWMSIGDGELLSTTKLAQDVAYDETKENTITNTIIADVTMNRTIKADYNTVCLPFTLTANQVTEAFGTGTEVYAFSEESTDPKRVVINFNKGDGSINANVPVLLKATAASTSQTFKGVQIVAAEEAKVEGKGKNFDFVGVYAPTTVAALDYFIGNGAIYKSEGNTNIKAFRAFIKNKSPEITGNSQEVKMFIGGIETAISEINDDANVKGTIYNLAGQRVSKAQKGLYIVNGKKVIIK